MTLRTSLLSVLLALSLSGCRDDTVEQADRAAKDVRERRAQLQASAEKLAETPDDGDIAARGAEVDERLDQLSTAQAAFETRRATIVEQYRVQHRVYAMQTNLVRSLLADPTLTPQARQRASDQILNLERELSEAEQAIDTLAMASAEQWQVAYTTAQTAMVQLEGAHQDAWDAISVERKLIRPS